MLWKGLGSSLTIRGLTLGVEDCLSKVPPSPLLSCPQVTPWPKEVDKHSSLKTIGQHLLLKCVSTAVITPFYSASLVETVQLLLPLACLSPAPAPVIHSLLLQVQSDIASEKPGVLDVFKEGIARLLSWSDPRW